MTPATATDLESAIAKVAARCLAARSGRAPDVGVDTPFAMLGLDSLGTIELGAALEEALGIEIPPDVVADACDARTLAAVLGRTSPPSPSDDRLARMLADAVLPDDVRPRRAIGQITRPTSLDDTRAVLVTGATGFLGASIVRELVERSRAQVHCLVRGGAPDRLHRRLEEAGLDVAAYQARLHVVDGDLRQPGLGMAPSAFAALSRDVDAICHAGAEVNWVYGYSALKPANVAGTLELIRLACLRSIPLHFVSSLSVCYSTAGPGRVDESHESLEYIGGVHLGYAQTKIVAEALVNEASRRGLPIVIHRPAIIAGDSVTGRFNPDDVLAALIRGCVRMGTAPDLDWQIDCVPVDVVARAIVRLRSAGGDTFHLKHPRPRHWRECVLWMRLYGYPLTLVSYHAWLRQLEAETGADPRHPLRPLRSFFLERIPGAGGLTLPELYEDTRRVSAGADRTERAREAAAIAWPPLDAALLDRYFAAYVDRGFLPRPATVVRLEPDTTDPPVASSTVASAFSRTETVASGFSRTDTVASGFSRTADDDFGTPAFFSRAMGTPVHTAEKLASGSDHSIVSELAAWRAGTSSGLSRYRVLLEREGERVTQEVVVKAKPVDRAVIDVGEAVARLCGERLGDTYAAFADRIGLVGSHRRELAIYAQSDTRFVRHAPGLLGTVVDEAAGRWVLVLEHIADGVLMDAVDRPEAWSRGHLARVVRGLAALQAIWLDRERELRCQPWIGHVPSSASIAEMSDLWRALGDHASPAFTAWAGPDMEAISRRLIRRIERWWPLQEQGPRTLIHHDFNPRNLCLRRHARTLRLCAYDWELATIGAPQHDLAELLSFVLPPQGESEEIDFWVEHHRQALARESGRALDPAEWRRGFQASVFDLLINRLPIYAMVNRIRRQTFLPRVVRTWRRLYEHVRRSDES